MGSLAAQQAAESDDGVHLAQIGEGPRGGWYLPCAGNANHFNLRPLCAAAHESVQRAFQQPLGNHRIPAGDDDSEVHSRGAEVAFDGHSLALYGIGPRPEAEGEARLRLDGKDARLPVRLRDRREALQGSIASLRAQPGCGGLMHGVESRHLHQHVGGGRELAIDKLQIAQRSQEGCAST